MLDKNVEVLVWGYDIWLFDLVDNFVLVECL